MRCKIKLCTYAKCHKIETVSSDGSTSKSNIRGSVLGKNKIPLETHTFMYSKSLILMRNALHLCIRPVFKVSLYKSKINFSIGKPLLFNSQSGSLE